MRHFTKLALAVSVFAGVASLMQACNDSSSEDPVPGADARAEASSVDDAGNESSDATHDPLDGGADANQDTSDTNAPDTGDSSASDGGPGGDAEAGSGCVVLPTSCPNPAMKYSDVESIFAARCVICHSNDNDAGRWPLTDFHHVSDWKDDIRTDVSMCKMPPVDAGVPITSEERLQILNWIFCGAQQ